MKYLLSGYSANGNVMMVIVAVIILIIGIYILYSASKMKKTKEPAEILFAESELKRIKNGEQLCEKLYPRMLVFAILCILYGIYGIMERLLFPNSFLEVAGVTVLVVFLVWFLLAVRQIKGEYLK